MGDLSFLSISEVPSQALCWLTEGHQVGDHAGPNRSVSSAWTCVLFLCHVHQTCPVLIEEPSKSPKMEACAL